MALDEKIAPNCLGYLKALHQMQILSSSFYLWLGHTFEVHPLPAAYSPGPLGQCYMNAGRLAVENPDLVYCEGWAFHAGIIPLHHAWCVDPSGKVIDPTWSGYDGLEYVGVALRRDFHLRQLDKHEVWGILSDGLPPDILETPAVEFLHPDWLPSEDGLQRYHKFSHTPYRAQPAQASPPP